MRDKPFLVFGQPDLRDEDVAAVVETLRSLWIGTGPRSQELERRFAEYVGAPHAVAVNSATAALHLGLLAAGVGPGDEVVVPAMTFASTANVVVHCGATPRFADVDPRSRCMGPAELEAALGPRVKAVIPVHLAGYPADLDALAAIAARHGAAMVVDAAHGIETRLRDERLGGRGFCTAYSFYVTKNITTGEGGMLTTADPQVAERVRVLSLHGLSADAWSRYSTAKTRTYEVLEPGFKYNMPDFAAALGLSQLTRIDSALARRAEIWRRYDEAFAGLPLLLPPRPDAAFGRSALHLYSPLVDESRTALTRDQVRERLHELGIGTGVHFTALHLHAYYRERFGLRAGSLPASERIGRTTFSLPFSSKLTDEEVDRVVTGVRQVLAN
jgi:dTDP-4-amino-4,6-dideoxygalactose transaminase